MNNKFELVGNYVYLNGEKVVWICGGNIIFENNEKIYNQELAYEIADYWKQEVEKSMVLASKVELTLEECIQIASSLYRGSYLKFNDIYYAICKLKNLKQSEYVKSSYDPRDNDYCDSYYTACIYKADSTIVDTFIKVLDDNDYIKKVTSRTVHLKNIKPSYDKPVYKVLRKTSNCIYLEEINSSCEKTTPNNYDTSDYINAIIKYGNGKFCQGEIYEKIKDTCVCTRSFINWHQNKFFPNATVDKLKELGWKEFYELNKDNIQKKREYFNSTK